MLVIKPRKSTKNKRMLITTNITKDLSAVLRVHLQSPAISPVIGYMGRDYVRRFSMAMKHNEAIAHNASSSKAAADTTVNPVSSFFHDINEFFPKPFFAGSPLSKQMEWIDDMRKYNYFPNYNIKTDGENLILSVDLPGVTLDDVKVEVKDNKSLHISGGRKTEGDD